MILKSFNSILLLFILVSFLIFYGCSSTSYTSRYGDSKNEGEEVKTQQRFSDAGEDSTEAENLTADDEEIPDDKGIDISSVMGRLKSDNNETGIDADNSSLKEKMLMEIIKYLNTPYKYGGNSSNGIDCSAFTQTLYSNVLAIDLNRTAREQYKQGEEIDNREDLQFGDLVFFNTRRRVKPGHVGIYIGDNLFAHASSKNGVIVSSLEQNYYSSRFMGGRRIEPENIF
jgi:cell wall-associated NlpC family hydrolase